MYRALIIATLCALVTSCGSKTEKTEITPEATTAIAFEVPKDVELASGTLHRYSPFPSKHIIPRNVDVWLPDGYTEDKKYTVVYMHDGQMLFDAKTTWNKQEWMVDEHASQLMKEGKTKDFIVVAPWNIAAIRWQDYFPAKAVNYLSEKDKEWFVKESKGATLNADSYLKFLVEELKPFIDGQYSTLTDRANTAVAGSSMGGLISMYAMCEYPDVFGAAACISTHWPGKVPVDDDRLPNAFFDYMEANLPSAADHSFYFDFGTETLDQFYPQYEAQVNEVFQRKGYDGTNFVNLKFEGADHSENSWNKRLNIPFEFILKQ